MYMQGNGTNESDYYLNGSLSFNRDCHGLARMPASTFRLICNAECSPRAHTSTAATWKRTRSDLSMYSTAVVSFSELLVDRSNAGLPKVAHGSELPDASWGSNQRPYPPSGPPPPSPAFSKAHQVVSAGGMQTRRRTPARTATGFSPIPEAPGSTITKDSFARVHL